MHEFLVSISFAAPHHFVAGAVAIAFAAMLWGVGYRARRNARASYGEAKLVDRHSKPLSFRLEALTFTGYALVLLLLSAAVAGPFNRGYPVRVQSGAVDVVVVTDVSRSMASEEYREFMPPRGETRPGQVAGAYGSRLDFVKHMIETRIMPALVNNRLGIVTYSGLGFLQAELTHDQPSLRWIMRHWMPIGGAPGNGSDFASGLREALQLFPQDGSDRQRVIVLFSDGGFTGADSELTEVVAELGRKNVRVIIVGVGSTQPTPIPVYSSSGESAGNLMRDGRPVLSTFEEGRLIALREAVQGEYIRLAPGDNLNLEWASLVAGERVDSGDRHLYVYPLSAAALLLLVLQLRGLLRILREKR